MSFTKTPAGGSRIQLQVGTVFTNIPGVEGIPGFGPDKQEYENTSISDAGRTYGTDLPDPGELQLSGSVDLRDSTHLQLSQNAANVLSSDNFKVIWASGAQATFAGKVMSFRISAQRGQDEKFECRVKLSGVVTFTAAT